MNKKQLEEYKKEMSHLAKVFDDKYKEAIEKTIDDIMFGERTDEEFRLEFGYDREDLLLSYASDIAFSEDELNTGWDYEALEALATELVDETAIEEEVYGKSE